MTDQDKAIADAVRWIAMILAAFGVMFVIGSIADDIRLMNHLNDWHKAGCAECADEEGKG